VDTVANDGGYRLIANQAFNDLDCGNLTLTANGEKGRTGSKKSVAECWR
ncbi:TPA: pilus assembly protein PilE, partial [Pseudomonas aeruginosa]